MEAADACEIARLPEELLAAALSLTTPQDARRAAAVSRDFCAAADSNAVWSCFVPRDLPPLADDELSGPAPASIKERFLRLSHRPALLADGLMSMWLDRETGAKCYMISARALHISWGDTPQYWRWIPLADSCSFREVGKLLRVCWLEIRGKINSKMLSQNSTYATYIVFKVGRRAYGLDYPYQKSFVRLGGNKSTRSVCLDGYDSDGEDREVEFQHVWGTSSTLRPSRRSRLEIPENVLLPQERADGWKEVEIGEFYNNEGKEGEVSISLTETSDTLKVGLIVQGVEIRPKKQKGH